MLSRCHFSTQEEAREVVVKLVVDFYNRRRRHSSCEMLTNGKADYWTYIQEAIWSMSSNDEDQQSYLKSSSLVSP